MILGKCSVLKIAKYCVNNLATLVTLAPMPPTPDVGAFSSGNRARFCTQSEKSTHTGLLKKDKKKEKDSTMKCFTSTLVCLYPCPRYESLCLFFSFFLSFFLSFSFFLYFFHWNRLSMKSLPLFWSFFILLSSDFPLVTYLPLFLCLHSWASFLLLL